LAYAIMLGSAAVLFAAVLLLLNYGRGVRA